MTLSRFKLLAAVLLLGSLALPQSSCTDYRAPNGEYVANIPPDSSPAGYEATVHRWYAFDYFDPADAFDWLQIAAFLWPLPLMALAARSRSARVRAALCLLDLLLAVGAGVLIWAGASMIAEPAEGAYLAVVALTTYFVASLVELWRLWRARQASPERPLETLPHSGAP